MVTSTPNQLMIKLIELNNIFLNVDFVVVSVKSGGDVFKNEKRFVLCIQTERQNIAYYEYVTHILYKILKKCKKKVDDRC